MKITFERILLVVMVAIVVAFSVHDGRQKADFRTYLGKHCKVTGHKTKTACGMSYTPYGIVHADCVDYAAKQYTCDDGKTYEQD